MYPPCRKSFINKSVVDKGLLTHCKIIAGTLFSIFGLTKIICISLPVRDYTKIKNEIKAKLLKGKGFILHQTIIILYIFILYTPIEYLTFIIHEICVQIR